MKRPPCPTCKSTKWRRDSATGLIACSEGHVLQNYRDETIEADNTLHQGARARRNQGKKEKKGRRSAADPKYLRGPRAEYFSYQIQQLLLRLQIQALIKAWDLPAREFEIACRDIWALYLATLGVPPEPEPLLYQQAAGIDDHPEPPVPKARRGPDSGSESIGNSDSDTTTESEAEPEPFRQSQRHDSATDSDSANTGDPDTFSPENTNWKRKSRAGAGAETRGPATKNLAILVVACWTLRIPIVCNDLVKLITDYALPYLEFQRLLPPGIPDIWKSKAHMSDAIPPTIIHVNEAAARLAKRIFVRCQVVTPELNAAPILWRAVRIFKGPPVLYVMSKCLASVMDVSLMLSPDAGDCRPQTGEDTWTSKYRLDVFPAEVRIVAIVILAMKLVYGLDGVKREPTTYDDPATSLPKPQALFKALRDHLVETHKGLEAILSPTSQQTVLDLTETEIDQYLDFCERALLRPDGKPIAQHRLYSDFDSVSRFFPLAKADDVNAPAIAPKATHLRFPAVPIRAPTPPHLEQTSLPPLLPGDATTHYKSADVLGTLPDDFNLIVTVGAEWLGVDEDDLTVAVCACENAIAWWAESRKRNGDGVLKERFAANRARRHPEDGAPPPESGSKSSKGLLYREGKGLKSDARWDPLENL